MASIRVARNATRNRPGKTARRNLNIIANMTQSDIRKTQRSRLGTNGTERHQKGKLLMLERAKSGFLKMKKSGLVTLFSAMPFVTAGF